jgi:hypothetical protein
VTLTFEMLFTVGGFLIALAGFAWGIVTWVIGQFAGRDAAIAEAKKDLAAHKLHAAETFATRSGVTESLDRVFAALDRLTGRVDELLRIERRKDDT